MYVYIAKIIRFDLRLIFYGGYSRLQGFDWRITFLFTFLTNQSADNARFNHLQQQSSRFNNSKFNHNNCFIKNILKKNRNQNINESRIFTNIHIFPIFLKTFVDFFPDYMKAFHHKYARLLGFNDLTETVAASTL